MGKIFYLMGPSSSGKDTIYKRLLGEKELELHTLVTYTTRPIRVGETEGVEYHFTDEEQLAELEKQGKVIELREYDTFHGVWKYFTVNDSSLDLENHNYLMIGTLESYEKTKKYLGEEYLVPILIVVDDAIRLQRALNREKKQENPKYQEMCRRYLADAVDFSDEKVEAAGIYRSFRNVNFEVCMREIKTYMKEML